MTQQTSTLSRTETDYNDSMHTMYAPYLFNDLHVVSNTGHVQSAPEVKALHLSLLGDFVLRVFGRPVSGLDMLRLQALLAYLALHHHLPGWHPF